jgi:hypothetical protein
MAAVNRELKTLLLHDQDRRWRAGERVGVETYFERYPQLAGDPDAALELIYNEVFLREQGGEQPELEEYLHRFPHLCDALRVQFHVHAAIVGGDATPTRRDPGERRAVAGYEVLGELGRGGMGVVWKARDPRLKCLVALKQLLPQGDDPALRRRFEVEAEAVARLAHPHIVRIFAAGEEAGRPWLAMEHVEGGSLESRLSRAAEDPRDAARLVLLLARAVHAAHRAGIVHRDLKPANVLLAPAADEPALNCAWGCPKLADFGLARRLDVSADLTGTGAILGTLAYMAPEQAGGRPEEAGPAADVYSLGAILYRLLTGEVPFKGDSLFAILDQVRSRPPQPPSRLAPGVPAELEAACLKCLAKPPGDRFASAADLALALERCLAGPGATRPLVGGRRLGRRTWLWAAAVVVLALLVGLAWWAGKPRPAGAGGADEGEQPGAPKLEAAMTVKVKPLGDKRWQPIDGPGALPVRPDDQVRVEVKLGRPAYSYLLLLSSQGVVTPLYPWNEEEKLRIKDVDAPPPQLREEEWAGPRAADRGWAVDDTPGLETLLLLVREEPLPPSVKLRRLIGEVPKGRLRNPGEAALLGLDRGRTELETLLSLERGFRDELRQVDEPLEALMKRLQGTFPVQRAARFAHVAE